jgi:uncharacterized membrane protein
MSPCANRWSMGLAVAFATVYTVFALGLHASFHTHGFDLGIFEQAVRSYAHGHLPVSTIRDANLILFGDHFSPIIAVLAPVYLLFSSAQTLLVAQALLFAVSVVPVTRTAIRLLNPAVGVVIGVCYGLSWGLQTALAFDFHEIAFAVPIMAFTLDALLRDRPGWAIAIASVLILVKEDLGVTVAALGLLVAIRPATRRLGLLTAAGGLAASAITVVLVIPAFSVDGTYRYLGVGGLRPTGEVFRGELFDPAKLTLVALILAPTLFLALRSPLVLLAVPTLAWRLAGTNLLYWQPGFHYDAILMPIVFFALIHALVLLRPATAKWIRQAALPAAVLGVAALLPLAVLLVAGDFRLREVLNPDFGIPPAYAGSARSLIARIPDGATVATENKLAPHLTGRTQVYLIDTRHPADWTLADRDRLPDLCPRLGFVRDFTIDGPLVLIHHPKQLDGRPRNAELCGLHGGLSGEVDGVADRGAQGEEPHRRR